MKRLERWPGSASALLDELCRTRPVLKAARATLITAYAWYNAKAPELAGVAASALGPSVKQALKAAYENAAAVDRVRKAILELAEFRCQYCGLGEGRTTTDHYVPKEDFPEYAVYPDNLVPCCWTCNQKRGERWLEVGSGLRKHVHLFFEKIPDQQVLMASIRVSKPAGAVKPKLIVNYWLRLGRSAPRGFAALYQRHVSSLSLLERYRGSAADEFNEWVAEIKWNGHGSKVGPGIVMKDFVRKAEASARLRGRNHWRTALLHAASRSDSLIKYLCS